MPELKGENVTDWQAEAQRYAGEATFWRMKYFEYMQHSQQIIAVLVRPSVEQSARQQADLLARLAQLQSTESNDSVK